MKEKLSAILDGDIDEASFDPVLDSLRQSPDLRDRWDTYCLIGDALRGEAAGGTDMVVRVMAGLDAEPTVLMPASALASRSQRFFGRSLMPIAASVMGVAAVGMVAFTLYPNAPDSAPVPGMVASQAVQEVVAARPEAATIAAVDAEDAHRQYMFVHQAMSGGGPIPGAVHYVRTVSDVRGEQR